MLRWHRETIVLKGEDITVDRLTDVCDRGFPGFALGYAAGKARALRHPKTVFAWVNNHLSHGLRIPVEAQSSTQR